MKEKLQEIKSAVEALLKNSSELDSLEDIRIKYLGKKGELTAVLKGMGKLTPEERPVIGALANEIRDFLTQEIDSKKAELEAKLQNERMKNEVIDVTMPGKKQ